MKFTVLLCILCLTTGALSSIRGGYEMMVGWGANRISVKLRRMGLAVTEFLPKESLAQGQFNEYAKFVQRQPFLNMPNILNNPTQMFPPVDNTAKLLLTKGMSDYAFSKLVDTSFNKYLDELSTIAEQGRKALTDGTEADKRLLSYMDEALTGVFRARQHDFDTHLLKELERVAEAEKLTVNWQRDEFKHGPNTFRLLSLRGTVASMDSKKKDRVLEVYRKAWRSHMTT